MISQLRAAPNQLTLLRLIFIPFVVIAVMEGHDHLALSLFLVAGISDALDGLLARILKQQTALGLYLDPIADKLLLSTLFLALSFLHRRIPWYVTILVFSRDIGILIVSTLLYATNTLRDLRPSIFGKLNTAAQVGTIFLVLLFPVTPLEWIRTIMQASFRVTFALTLISWIHYTFVVGRRLRHTSTPSST
jgi:cardiolipin synthase